MDDKETFKQLSKGEAAGIFQLKVMEWEVF